MFSLILKARRWHWWILIGVKCDMIKFLFYKDHQAVVWSLEKTGGRWRWLGIDGYWSYFSKTFTCPGQRKLLPRTSFVCFILFLNKVFKKGKRQDLGTNVLWGLRKRKRSIQLSGWRHCSEWGRGSSDWRTQQETSKFLSETRSSVFDLLRVKC